MHVFDSPNGVNHVSYMTELKSYFPKNTQPQNIQPPPAFTFVREPLSHFASGLAEYHFRCTPKKNVTKQTIRQVGKDSSEWKEGEGRVQVQLHWTDDGLYNSILYYV